MTKFTLNSINLINFKNYDEFTVPLPSKVHQKSAFLANTTPEAPALTHLGAAGGRGSEFAQVGPQCICPEVKGPAGPHVQEPLQELRPVLGEVQPLHGSPLGLGHDGHPDIWCLVASAADPLHLRYPVQHRLHSRLQSSLDIEYVLTGPNITDIEANYHV